MKKLFALLIAVMLVFSCCAMAEEASVVEALYEGAWIPFVDDGFEMYIPADWDVYEVTDEMLENGIYFVTASPDGAMTFQMAWRALDELMDTSALHADLQTAYPEAEIMAFGEYDVVCFADMESDVLGFAMSDAVDPGMYVFNFTPASDEDSVVLATCMMSSLRPVS